jgi:hypothetical protein
MKNRQKFRNRVKITQSVLAKKRELSPLVNRCQNLDLEENSVLPGSGANFSSGRPSHHILASHVFAINLEDETANTLSPGA